ncbi:MAG: DJ-1/PfpI family protein, partial [Planctomycetota bacterium]
MADLKPKTIAVAAYNGLLGYEFGIVTELFGLVRPGLEDCWYDFKVCRVEKGELTTSHGLRIEPPFRMRDLVNADMVIVPGWRSPQQKPKPTFLRALQNAHSNGARMISVCTGAFALAHAGVLDGRSITTHWLYVEQFREQFPDVHVEANRLYIHDGQISTSAGASAGLDLCLSIIRQDLGVEAANLVARRMVAPLHREGGQSQYVSPDVIATDDDEIGPILDWLAKHFAQDVSIPALASRSKMS